MEFENRQLAKDDEEFLINSRQNHHDALLSMLQQAHLSLDIYSYNLDGSLYDTDEYLTAIKQLSLNSKNSKIRILLKDTDYVNKHGHRFVTFARRLPSFMEIRQVNSDFEHIISCYSIVDERGIIFRSDALRYEAKINFNGPLLARELLKQFNQIWNHSEPSQEMRSLHI